MTNPRPGRVTPSPTAPYVGHKARVVITKAGFLFVVCVGSGQCPFKLCVGRHGYVQHDHPSVLVLVLMHNEGIEEQRDD